MIVASHPRRSPRSRNVQTYPRSSVLTGFASNSHGIISFADPHHLTLIESYRSKNEHPAKDASPERPSGADGSHLPRKSFTCNTYGPPRKCCKQKTYGVGTSFSCNTYKKQGYPPQAKHFSLSSLGPPVTRPKSFPFTLLRTLLHARKTQLVCFQSIPHSLPKNTGGMGVFFPFWNAFTSKPREGTSC